MGAKAFAQAPRGAEIAAAAIRIIFFDRGAFISLLVLCHHCHVRKGG